MNEAGKMYQTQYTVKSSSDTALNIELNPPATFGTAARQASLGMIAKDRKHINAAFKVKLNRRTECSLSHTLRHTTYYFESQYRK